MGLFEHEVQTRKSLNKGKKTGVRRGTDANHRLLLPPVSAQTLRQLNVGHPLLYKHRPESGPGKSGPKWGSSSSETANKTLSITPHVVLQAEVSLIGQSRAAMESSEAVGARKNVPEFQNKKVI